MCVEVEIWLTYLAKKVYQEKNWIPELKKYIAVD
jgi:hypothetical protein